MRLLLLPLVLALAACGQAGPLVLPDRAKAEDPQLSQPQTATPPTQAPQTDAPLASEPGAEQQAEPKKE